MFHRELFSHDSRLTTHVQNFSMSNQLKQDHNKLNPKTNRDINSSPRTGQEGLLQYLQGRGAQINTKNRFLKDEQTKEHIEGIDDWEESNIATQYLEQEVKSIVNKVESPDLSMMYSMNPYAGCEHGCIYCYARNVHEYWGYSAGLDFESKDHRKSKCAAGAPENFNE